MLKCIHCTANKFCLYPSRAFYQRRHFLIPSWSLTVVDACNLVFISNYIQLLGDILVGFLVLLGFILIIFVQQGEQDQWKTEVGQTDRCSRTPAWRYHELANISPCPSAPMNPYRCSSPWCFPHHNKGIQSSGHVCYCYHFCMQNQHYPSKLSLFYLSGNLKLFTFPAIPLPLPGTSLSVRCPASGYDVAVRNEGPEPGGKTKVFQEFNLNIYILHSRLQSSNLPRILAFFLSLKVHSHVLYSKPKIEPLVEHENVFSVPSSIACFIPRSKLGLKDVPKTRAN